MTLFKTWVAYTRLAAYLMKLSANLLYGVWKISHLKNAPVTVFGGTHLKMDSDYLKKASQLAQMLANTGIPVLTGGGPGIMEAAACGALSVHKGAVITSIGISVKGLYTGIEHSVCKRNVIEMDNFPARKWLLINYSLGFAVFPGGFGTLDELTGLLTLIQTKKRSKAPIVLIGKDYWKPFVEWIEESALAEGLVSVEDVALFSITDDVNEAYNLLKTHCEAKPFTIFTDH